MTVPIVQLWTGREARALREAKRMSLVAFAGHLGVSERMLSKWEEGGEKIHPRPVNQQALDSSLSASSAEVQTRFAALVGLDSAGRPGWLGDPGAVWPSVSAVISSATSCRVIDFSGPPWRDVGPKLVVYVERMCATSGFGLMLTPVDICSRYM